MQLSVAQLRTDTVVGLDDQRRRQTDFKVVLKKSKEKSMKSTAACSSSTFIPLDKGPNSQALGAPCQTDRKETFVQNPSLCLVLFLSFSLWLFMSSSAGGVFLPVKASSHSRRLLQTFNTKACGELTLWDACGVDPP